MKHITYQFSKTVFLKSILVLISLLYTLNTQSQTKSQYKSSETEEVFTIVEQMPSFPGGEKELYRFIGLTITYPVEAQVNNESGKIYVSFVVNTDGNLTDIRILRGISKSLNNEALRIVSLMPRWIPGTQGGTAVKVRFYLPIRFVSGKNPKKENKNNKKNKRVKTNGYFTESHVIKSEVIEIPKIIRPQFNGGELALKEYINTNLRYPKKALKNNESGIVYISCLISKKGKVVETWFLNSISPSIDREAGRLVKKMPPWIPGTKNGKNAKIKITISIKFTLN